MGAVLAASSHVLTSCWPCSCCEPRLRQPSPAALTALCCLAQVGRDPRPVMRAAYQCFQDGADPASIVAAAGADTAGHDAFYAWLYVGLWQEAHGDEAAAKDALLRALGTQYFKFSGDYMAALAGVHCAQRGWA